MHDPDVVLAVHGHTNGHAQDPMVRKRLWPQRVHFKLRRLDARGSDGSALFEEGGNDPERDEKSEKGCGHLRFVFHHFPPLSGVVRRGTAVIGYPPNSQNPT
ncbi:MAG TPA: hypothetical protein VKA81_04810, partial [Verrucomicrobiae bacterium]|nr:hypothetical protein [Verrucomicrobiae bacterium]